MILNLDKKKEKVLVSFKLGKFEWNLVIHFVIHSFSVSELCDGNHIDIRSHCDATLKS